MAIPEHVEIVKQGADAIADWRHGHPTEHLDLADAVLQDADLSGADLSGADLSRVNFRAARLHEACLRETHLNGCTLVGAVLTRAELEGARIMHADLRDADLRLASLAGASLWQADLRRADLRGASLVGSYLGWTRCRRARFNGADLRGANMRGADLRDVQLEGAILRDVKLTSSDLRSADLRGADATGARFHWANLSDANLRGASLQGAVLSHTVLGDTDLGAATDLESIEHAGPSVIDFATIARSWPVPVGFLRGCGLPDQFIDYLPSLVGQAIEFYSCFISYSSRDDDFAKRLHADLQDKNVRCWFAPKDLPIGAKQREFIDESIRVHDKLLLVLSEHSVKSGWVEKEFATAIEAHEKTGRSALFPIRLDDSVMQIDAGWPADVRRIWNIGDFTHWKDHDSYQQALERLLHDLKAET